MAKPRIPRATGLLIMASMIVLLAVLRLYPGTQSPPAPEHSAPTRVESPAARAPSAPRGFGASVGFRTRERLHEHFVKHGHEFRAADSAQYLALAQALRDAEVGGDVLESVRADGVVSRFDRASGTFIAFDADGTLRTCFKPNDGERYFVRQAKRRPG